MNANKREELFHALEDLVRCVKPDYEFVDDGALVQRVVDAVFPLEDA